MTVEQFRESLCRDDPPTGLDFALAGLWWDAKGNWAKAHESAQQDEGPAGSQKGPGEVLVIDHVEQPAGN